MKSKSRFRVIVSAASAICLLAGVTLAQNNLTWNMDNAGGNEWSDVGNWQNGPVSDNRKVFISGDDFPSRAIMTNDLTNLRVGGFGFWRSATNVTLRGNAITLGGAIVYENNPEFTREHTIELDLVLDGNRRVQALTDGAFHISGNIGQTGTSRALTIESQNLSPTAYVRLSGENTFTGLLAVDNRAKLYVSSVGNLGLGNIEIRQNATLFAEGDIETSQALNHVGLNSAINVSSGKTLTLNGVWTANAGAAPRKEGPGDLVLSNSGNDMNDETLTVIAGGIYLGHANAMNNGTLKMNSSAARLDNVSGSAMTVTSMDGFDLTTGFEFLGTDDLDLSAIETSFIQVDNSERDIGVRDGTLRISGIQTVGTTPGAGDRRDGSLVKSGVGTLEITSESDYTLGTTVAAGRLLVNNATGSGTGFGDVTVNADAALGGSGTIGGNVLFEDGAKFVFDPTVTLTIAEGKQVEFQNFRIEDLVLADGSAIDWSLIDDDIYTLIAGSVDFDNIVHTFDNQYDLGDGRTAYFKEGSLQLVVIPEPAALGMMLAAMAGLLGFRRLFGR